MEESTFLPKKLNNLITSIESSDGRTTGLEVVPKRFLSGFEENSLQSTHNSPHEELEDAKKSYPAQTFKDEDSIQVQKTKGVEEEAAQIIRVEKRNSELESENEDLKKQVKLEKARRILIEKRNRQLGIANKNLKKEIKLEKENRIQTEERNSELESNCAKLNDEIKLQKARRSRAEKRYRNLERNHASLNEKIKSKTLNKKESMEVFCKRLLNLIFLLALFRCIRENYIPEAIKNKAFTGLIDQLLNHPERKIQKSLANLLSVLAKRFRILQNIPKFALQGSNKLIAGVIIFCCKKAEGSGSIKKVVKKSWKIFIEMVEEGMTENRNNFLNLLVRAWSLVFILLYCLCYIIVSHFSF